MELLGEVYIQLRVEEIGIGEEQLFLMDIIIMQIDEMEVYFFVDV
jgi:hypothetical protein